MTQGFRPKALVYCSLAALMGMSVHASAGTLTFQLNTTLSGTLVPNLSTLQAVITDVALNEVSIKMDATNLSSFNSNEQFISNWGFNIDPSLAFTSTNLIVQGSPVLTGGVSVGPADLPIIGDDNGGFNPSSAGNFDIVFVWSGSNHSFVHGTTVTYDLKYIGSGTLNAASFNFPTTNGDLAYSLTKIQGYGFSGELGTDTPGTSGPTPDNVPEISPASATSALACLAIGVSLLNRRRGKRSAG